MLWIPAFRSLHASIGFQSLHPFLNPSNFPADGVILGDYKTVTWPNPKENSVCTMFGAVHACNLIHPGYIGSHPSRVIGIIPTFDALYGFQRFLRSMYATPDLYAPFDYGCILSSASRREGLTSPCLCPIHFHHGCPANLPLSQLKQDARPLKQPQAQHKVVWRVKDCTSSSFVVSEKLPPLP
jgi:hypothetical protein